MGMYIYTQKCVFSQFTVRISFLKTEEKAIIHQQIVNIILISPMLNYVFWHIKHYIIMLIYCTLLAFLPLIQCVAHLIILHPFNNQCKLPNNPDLSLNYCIMPVGTIYLAITIYPEFSSFLPPFWWECYHVSFCVFLDK